MENRNVAIIGGGPHGLITLYECKRWHIDAVLYEKESSIGGVWNLDANMPTSHLSTTFNSSLMSSSFDVDFTIVEYMEQLKNDSMGDYCTSSEFYEYLKSFVERYDLRKSIRFNVKITSINRDGNSEKFILNGLSSEDSELKEFVHDHVIVAGGRFGKMMIPDEPFLSKELNADETRIWHTKRWDPLNINSKVYSLLNTDKLEILVIGGGHSAGEAIQDTIRLSKITGKCRLKIFWAPTREPKRRKLWIMDRYPYHGRKAKLPLDESGCRLFSIFPLFVFEWAIAKASHCVTSQTNNARFSLENDLFSICDTKLIKAAAADGIIEMVNETVERIYKTSNNGMSFATAVRKDVNVDLVILATGYDYAEPMVDGQFLLTQSVLYRQMVPISECYNGQLAFLCTTPIFGSAIGITQMESRWLLYHWFKNRKSLDNALDKIRKQNVFVSTNQTRTRRFPMAVLETLAKDINIQRNMFLNLLSINSKNRRLALASLLGPFTIHQYENIDETRAEKLHREEFLLRNVERCFKKSGGNFTLICKIFDWIYFSTFFAGLMTFVYGGSVLFKCFHK